MNVVQLQYFIKVFDYQNYSDAATILSVSPQAVSKGIHHKNYAAFEHWNLNLV